MKESLALWTALNDGRAMAVTMECMDGCFLPLGREEEALSYAQRSLALYRQYGEASGEAAMLNNLSIAYKKIGDIAQSQEMLHQSLA